MCFSAEASFITSGILAATGGIAATHLKNHRERFIVAVPFVFATQQFIEGMLWLAEKPSLLASTTTYLFLIIAYGFWPLFGPHVAYFLEHDEKRKKIIGFFKVLGIAVATILLASLLFAPPEARIAHNHIEYFQNFPYYFIIGALYPVAVCGACFASSHKQLNIFGGTILLAFFASFFFYSKTVGSVWCFFSAALSIAIVVYLSMKNRPQF